MAESGEATRRVPALLRLLAFPHQLTAHHALMCFSTVGASYGRLFGDIYIGGLAKPTGTHGIYTYMKYVANLEPR